MNYYFLASAFPDLHVGVSPEISFYELIHLLKENLTAEDYEKVRAIRRFYDIQNLRALWKGEELDKWGNLDVMGLDEAILTRDDFAKSFYVDDFLNRFDKTKERLIHFPQLVAGYYNEEISRSTGFLHQFLSFEREWRLVLTAFRAKKLNRDILKELQYEDPSHLVVAQILAQKDAPHFEPPDRYSELKPLFMKYEEHPFELHQALCEYRFEKVQEMIGLDRFSIDYVLSFLVKYIIVDKWLELDKKKGLEIVESIVKETA